MWKTVSSKTAYASEWLEVQRDDVIMPDGTASTYEIVKRNDFVVVIPIANDKFYLVDQYRYPIKQRSLEFPEGGLKDGEDPLTGAKRELREETGLISEQWQNLGFLYLANGSQSQKFFIFVATDCIQKKHSRDGAEMDMTVEIISVKDLMRLIKEGGIKDSPTVAAWSLYLLSKEKYYG